MQSRLTNLASCGLAPFTFAGMTFPKHLWTLPRGTLQKRLADRAAACYCSGYYHAPTPIGKNHGIGFYLASDGAPGLRWTWADEVDGVRIPHKGWYSDNLRDGNSDTIRGVVFRLPHGRGFLAGWSMGEGMSSELDCSVWAEERDAAREADRMAERAAEREREYQAEQDALQD